MKIGIVGGIGPESTIEYYKCIIREYQRIINDGSFPKVIIDSIDMSEMLHYIATKDFDQVTKLLVDSLQNIHDAGATCAIIASNTPHVVFNSVSKKSQLPLISIVEETCKRACEKGFKKVGLFGTAFTMKHSYYKDHFAPCGIEIIVPNEMEQAYIHDKIFTEIEAGIFRPDTKAKFLEIAERMIREESIDSLILGCTELPLFIFDSDCSVPLLNTIEIHVEGVFGYLQRSGQLGVTGK